LLKFDLDAQKIKESGTVETLCQFFKALNFQYCNPL